MMRLTFVALALTLYGGVAAAQQRDTVPKRDSVAKARADSAAAADSAFFAQQLERGGARSDSGAANPAQGRPGGDG
jgi:hypothetical protein